jgi:hypothetical protein
MPDLFSCRHGNWSYSAGNLTGQNSMLIGVFGTPSPLTYWTLHAVRTIAQVVRPNYSFISALRFDDLKASWNAIDANARQQIVFYSDCPEAQITDMFTSLEVPIILATDNAEDIVPFCAATRLMQVEHAIRLMSQSASTLYGLRDAKNLWRIRNDLYQWSVLNFVHQAIDFYEFKAEDDDLHKIMTYLTLSDRPLSSITIGQEILRIIDKARIPGTYEFNRDEDRALFSIVAPQYDRVLRNEPVDSILWPRDIFCDGDRPEQLVCGPRSLIGRARTLIFGPYLHLPRGAWIARIDIEIRENFSGNRLCADVVLGGVVANGIKAHLPRSGVYSFDLDVDIREPLLPIELRIQILEGAIEGLLLLRTVELTRADASRVSVDTSVAQTTNNLLSQGQSKQLQASKELALK